MLNESVVMLGIEPRVGLQKWWWIAVVVVGNLNEEDLNYSFQSFGNLIGFVWLWMRQVLVVSLWLVSF